MLIIRKSVGGGVVDEIKKIAQEQIDAFHLYLIREEKSKVTIEKYIRDVKAFLAYGKDAVLEKEVVTEYKKKLIESGYAVRSVNSMLASINSFMDFMERTDCKVKTIKIQRQIYSADEETLRKGEGKERKRISA